MQTTRRGFVGKSIQGAVALATGTIAATAARPARSQSPGEKVVLGLIGAGGRGRYLLNRFLAMDNVEAKYVCDVEEARGQAGAAEAAQRQGYRPEYVTDMRAVLDDPDVDAVIVATPEHWHAVATVWACQAGKDVLVEKNLARTIWESRKMIEAARKYDRVVQTGFQCRSAPYIFAARDYIAAGELGTVLFVKVFNMLPFVYGSYPLQPTPDSEPPAGLDWDRWLGPAPERPYNAGVHRNWYGYWEYSGGNASDAVHTLDVARMVLGDPPHPAAVNCAGGRWQYDDGGEMPDVQMVTFEFDRLVMTFENTGFTPYMFKTPQSIRDGDQFPFWPQNSSRIEIYGTKRMMYLGRHGGGWQVLESGPQELGTEFGNVVAQQFGRFPDDPHMVDFVQCIRERKRPNGDIEVCHYSAALEYLANMAYRAGNRKLHFDGATETFPDDAEANRLLRPSYRSPYRMPDSI
jgi:predicted dehydrogenase